MTQVFSAQLFLIRKINIFLTIDDDDIANSYESDNSEDDVEDDDIEDGETRAGGKQLICSELIMKLTTSDVCVHTHILFI